jgi:hypothetical protein
MACTIGVAANLPILEVQQCAYRGARKIFWARASFLMSGGGGVAPVQQIHAKGETRLDSTVLQVAPHLGSNFGSPWSLAVSAARAKMQESLKSYRSSSKNGGSISKAEREELTASHACSTGLCITRMIKQAGSPSLRSFVGEGRTRQTWQKLCALCALFKALSGLFAGNATEKAAQASSSKTAVELEIDTTVSQGPDCLAPNPASDWQRL